MIGNKLSVQAVRPVIIACGDGFHQFIFHMVSLRNGILCHLRILLYGAKDLVAPEKEDAVLWEILKVIFTAEKACGKLTDHIFKRKSVLDDRNRIIKSGNVVEQMLWDLFFLHDMIDLFTVPAPFGKGTNGKTG